MRRRITCHPFWNIHGITAAFGVPLITNLRELAMAAKAVEAVASGVSEADGVIVAAFGDPGSDALACALRCPVIGIGAASMQAAAAGGRNFSVATTTPDLVASIRQRADALGVGHQLVSVRVTVGDPARLTADPVALKQALEAEVWSAIDEGAAAVVIGGGPLARAARALAPSFAVPIIEPIPSAVRWMADRLKS